jgi:hypothetical protein
MSKFPGTTRDYWLGEDAEFVRDLIAIMNVEAWCARNRKGAPPEG